MPSKKKIIRKEIKREAILKIFGWEVFLFFLTFVIGIFSATKIQSFLDKEKIVLPTISFSNFISYFIFATFIILLIVYLPKIKKIRAGIYKLFFVFTVVYGALAVLPLLFGDILALFIIVILLYFWFKRPAVVIHDFLMIISMAGIGAMFGLSFEPKIVILLLIIFSVYDFIAVYKTKHMVKMAESMLETGVIMGLIIPQKISDFLENPKEIKLKGKFVILGGGDVVFPLIFSISMFSQGIINTLIVAFFSLLGLMVSFTLFILQKKRKPIPALPPIALLSIIGYIITLLI